MGSMGCDGAWGRRGSPSASGRGRGGGGVVARIGGASGAFDSTAAGAGFGGSSTIPAPKSSASSDGASTGFVRGLARLAARAGFDSDFVASDMTQPPTQTVKPPRRPEAGGAGASLPLNAG